MRIRCGWKCRSARATCTALNEFGLAAHWAYKQGGTRPDGQVGWLRDLIEIVDASHDAEELLEHTRLADLSGPHLRLHPQGRAAPAAQGRDAGRLRLCRPHRSGRADGRGQDQRAAHAAAHRAAQRRRGGDHQGPASPNRSCPGWASSSPARRAPRSAARCAQKERAEVAAIGRKLFDEIADRLPAKIGKKAITRGGRAAGPGGRGRADVRDRRGQAQGPRRDGSARARQHRRSARARSSRNARSRSAGSQPGVGFQLAECCHPVPGDRIVGLRHPGERVEVHTIDCLELASGVDADWVDLSWGERSHRRGRPLAGGALQPPRHAGRSGRHLRQEPRQCDEPRSSPSATIRSTPMKWISKCRIWRISPASSAPCGRATPWPRRRGSKAVPAPR